jgi:hypothetical protein
MVRSWVAAFYPLTKFRPGTEGKIFLGFAKAGRFGGKEARRARSDVSALADQIHQVDAKRFKALATKPSVSEIRFE